MSDIRKLLDILNETSAGATSSGSVATVAQEMSVPLKRVTQQKKEEKTPEVIEYGMWENSAYKTSESLKKNRDRGSKIVKSIYGEDTVEEDGSSKQQAAIAIAKKKKVSEGYGSHPDGELSYNERYKLSRGIESPVSKTPHLVYKIATYIDKNEPELFKRYGVEFINDKIQEITKTPGIPGDIHTLVLMLKEKLSDEEVMEGYILKKTNVEKTFEPGDPDEYYTSGGADVTTKHTDYEIINNKTGKVVGTASWTTNDYFGPGALKITMKNGATRWLDIWEREKGNPQTAFNRFVKDPKTAKKYKDQEVAEGFSDVVKGIKRVVKGKEHPDVVASKHAGRAIGHYNQGDIAAGDKETNRYVKTRDMHLKAKGVAEGLEDAGVQDAIIDTVEKLFYKNDLSDYSALEAIRQGVKHHFSKPGATAESAIEGILNILDKRMRKSDNYLDLRRFKEALRQGVAHQLKKQGVAEGSGDKVHLKTPKHGLADHPGRNTGVGLRTFSQTPEQDRCPKCNTLYKNHYKQGVAKGSDNINEFGVDFNDIKRGDKIVIEPDPHTGRRSSFIVLSKGRFPNGMLAIKIKDKEGYSLVNFLEVEKVHKATKQGVAEGLQKFNLKLESIEKQFGEIKLSGGIVNNNQSLIKYLAKHSISTDVFDHLVEQKIGKVMKDKRITESIDKKDTTLNRIFSDFNDFSTGNKVKVGDSVAVLNLEALSLSTNSIELSGFLKPETITHVDNDYVEFESEKTFPKQKIIQLRMWRQVIFFHDVEQAKKCLTAMSLHAGNIGDWKFSINVNQKISELRDKTLKSYQEKVSADAMKHPADPTKRSPEKANRSVAGFAKAQKRLDKDITEAGKKIPASNKPVKPEDLVVSLKDVPVKKPRGHTQYDPAKEFPGVKAFKKQGVAEGSTEQVYKVLAVDKSNALSKQVKLKVKASSLDEVFERLAINNWYPLEINGVEVINGKRLKQGVAETSGDKKFDDMISNITKSAGTNRIPDHLWKRIGPINYKGMSLSAEVYGNDDPYSDNAYYIVNVGDKEFRIHDTPDYALISPKNITNQELEAILYLFNKNNYGSLGEKDHYHKVTGPAHHYGGNAPDRMYEQGVAEGSEEGNYPNNELGRAQTYFQKHGDADMGFEDIVDMMTDAGFSEKIATEIALDAGRVDKDVTEGKKRIKK